MNNEKVKQNIYRKQDRYIKQKKLNQANKTSVREFKDTIKEFRLSY